MMASKKDVDFRIAVIEEAVRMGRAGEESYLMKVCLKHGISLPTLHRWMRQVKSLPRSEWGVALQPSPRRGRPPLAEITAGAWEYFIDLIRHGSTFRAAYLACVARAERDRWAVPSENTFRRRLTREDLSLLRRRALSEFDI